MNAGSHLSSWVSGAANAELSDFWPCGELPKALEFPIRVFGLRYTWFLQNPQSQWNDLGPFLLHALHSAEVGKNGRPVVLIGIDFGGILAKALLQTCRSHPHWKQSAFFLCGLLFIGTPHREEEWNHASSYKGMLAALLRVREPPAALLQACRDQNRLFFENYGFGTLFQTIGPADERMPVPRRVMDIATSERIKHNYVPLLQYEHNTAGHVASNSDVRLMSVASFVRDSVSFAKGSFG